MEVTKCNLRLKAAELICKEVKVNNSNFTKKTSFPPLVLFILVSFTVFLFTDDLLFLVLLNIVYLLFRFMLLYLLFLFNYSPSGNMLRSSEYSEASPVSGLTERNK